MEDLPSAELQPRFCACSEGPAFGQNTDDDDDYDYDIWLYLSCTKVKSEVRTKNQPSDMLNFEFFLYKNKPQVIFFLTESEPLLVNFRKLKHTDYSLADCKYSILSSYKETL